MRYNQNDSPARANYTTLNQSFAIQKLTESRNDDHELANYTNYFQIICICKGKGALYIDLKKKLFQENQLLFIKPRQAHQFSPCENTEGYIISFAESFLSMENQQADIMYYSSLFQLFANDGCSMSEDFAVEISNLAEKMLAEYSIKDLFREEMLQRYLRILFVYLSRQYNGRLAFNPPTRNDELAGQFITLVDKNFKTEKTVSGYASLLFVTPNYLNEIVKKVTGYSAGHHIRQRIVLEAKRQAIYSGTCMKQIGYYLGFNDMAHFSKFFKSASGKNFTDFKKEKMVVANSFA